MGQVRVDADADRRFISDGRKQVDQIALVLHRGDAIEVGLERCRTLGGDGRLIHPAAVEIADLLADRP